MENDENLEVYVRPIITPSFVLNSKNIRINYRGYWVDCRNGEIRISDINGKIKHREMLP